MVARNADEEVQLDRLRRACLALPEAFEQEAWGEPTFRVKKRMFASFAGTHHRDGHVAAWCPAPLGVQEALVRADAAAYFVPPYVGVKGWIGIELANVSDAALRDHVVEAYCMVAPKKLQALVDP